jgi:hypothetical protein
MLTLPLPRTHAVRLLARLVLRARERPEEYRRALKTYVRSYLVHTDDGSTSSRDQTAARALLDLAGDL